MPIDLSDSVGTHIHMVKISQTIQDADPSLNDIAQGSQRTFINNLSGLNWFNFIQKSNYAISLTVEQ